MTETTYVLETQDAAGNWTKVEEFDTHGDALRFSERLGETKARIRTFEDGRCVIVEKVR